MLLQSLRANVLEANLELVHQGLVLDTFGNASGIDREQGLVVIKPSGVPYDSIRPEDLVVTDLKGNIAEGRLRPSSDLETHLEHPIPCLGTTHADYFYGPVPVTDPMSDSEIANDYEANTGKVILRALAGIDPAQMPAVIVANHGPFAWGTTPQKAARNAFLLEEIARMAFHTITLNASASQISAALLNRHYLRKHGKDASYGQPI